MKIWITELEMACASQKVTVITAPATALLLSTAFNDLCAFNFAVMRIQIKVKRSLKEELGSSALQNQTKVKSRYQLFGL